MKRLLAACLLLAALTLTACGSPVDKEYAGWTITVRGDGVEGEQTYTLAELAALPEARFAAVYSVINNWPTVTSYAAEGVKIASILELCGVLDTAQTVTIGSEDGYRASFTRQQLLESTQFSYPNCGENGEGAEPVYPIIAYNWKQGGADLADVRPDAPCLVLGQTDWLQHNNPVFVEGVTYIEVSDESEQWPPPFLWPEQAVYHRGDRIKLQHDAYSNVKIYYTLDGSEPDVYSAMYNPSTYQPELNEPIEVTGDMTVRAFAAGYGKADSEVAEFPIEVEE